MRKLLMAALLVVTIAGSAFATETTTVSSTIANSFAYDFKKASDVTWSTSDNYVKATFVLNNQRMEAFYNVDGEKIGSSTAFNVEELPMNAKRVFAKKYSGYTVKQAIAFTGTEETEFYISAENDKEAVILKVDSLGAVSTYKRTSK
jgi:hypothetical protein